MSTDSLESRLAGQFLEALTEDELEALRAASLDAILSNLGVSGWACSSDTFTLRFSEEFRALLDDVALSVLENLSGIAFVSLAILTVDNSEVLRAANSDALSVNEAESRVAEDLNALLGLSQDVSSRAADSDASVIGGQFVVGSTFADDALVTALGHLGRAFGDTRGAFLLHADRAVRQLALSSVKLVSFRAGGSDAGFASELESFRALDSDTFVSNNLEVRRARNSEA